MFKGSVVTEITFDEVSATHINKILKSSNSPLDTEGTIYIYNENLISSIIPNLGNWKIRLW